MKKKHRYNIICLVLKHIGLDSKHNLMINLNGTRPLSL